MEYISSTPAYMPCPQNRGWELIKNIQIIKESKYKGAIGGFSAVTYDKNLDTLFLLSDFNETFILRINYFSEFISQAKNKIIVNEDNILKLSSKNGGKFLKKLDGEGIVIDKNSIFILNETRIWNWRKPFEIYEKPSIIEFNLRSGKKIRSINLPNSWKYGTSGIESLSISKKGNLVAVTEGRNYHNYYRPRFIKLLKRFKIYQTNKTNAISDSYKSARYLSINKNSNNEKESNLLIEGKVRDLLILDKPQKTIFLTTFSGEVFFNIFNINDSDNNLLINQFLFKWKLPSNAKWEGIAKGPLLSSGKGTILLVNDNDNDKGKKNYISVFVPFIKDFCILRKDNKMNYQL